MVFSPILNIQSVIVVLLAVYSIESRVYVSLV